MSTNETDKTPTNETETKPTPTKNARVKKALSITVNVLLYVFFAICVFALITSIRNRKQGDTFKLFGYEMRYVLTGSMERNPNTDVSGFRIKSIPQGSVVFIKVIPEIDVTSEEEWQMQKDWLKDLKVGDVLTFYYSEYSSQTVITHRITKITPKDDGHFIIELRGDNDDDIGQVLDTADYGNGDFNEIIGKVVGKSVVLGGLLTLLKKPWGMALVVIVPCAIVILMEVIKIVNTINESKRQKMAEANASEMDELKRRLAQLEGNPAAEQPQQAEGNAPPEASGDSEQTAAPQGEQSLDGDEAAMGDTTADGTDESAN